MKRSPVFKIVIAALALVSLLGPATLAQDARRGGPPGAAWGRGDGGALGPLGGILRMLDLTEEQRKQVHAQVTDAMQGELGQSLRDLEDERHKLRQLAQLDREDRIVRVDAPLRDVEPRQVHAAVLADVRTLDVVAVADRTDHGQAPSGRR